MARVGFLLTTTPWNDRRQNIRQAPALKDAGHDVIYMAGLPDEIDKSRFEYVDISAKRRNLSRKTGATNLFFDVLKVKPEIVQLCSVEQLPLGLALKLFSRTKVVYDCREDMAPSLLQHRDGVPKPVRIMLYHAVNWLEGLACRFFDAIVTADPFVYEKHSAMPEDRKMVFYNAAQIRDFTRDYPPLGEREHDLVIMGSMSPRTGVLDVLTATGELYQEGRSVKVLLLGQPDESVVGLMDQVIEKYGIRELVTITGKIDHKKVPKVLSTAKIGVVPLLDFEKFRNNIACKAFEYMACGMPCICSELRPQKVFIQEPENGYFYPPGDVSELKVRITLLLDDRKKMQRIGDVNRDLVERKWNAEYFERELQYFYKYILESPKR